MLHRQSGKANLRANKARSSMSLSRSRSKSQNRISLRHAKSAIIPKWQPRSSVSKAGDQVNKPDYSEYDHDYQKMLKEIYKEMKAKSKSRESQ